MGSEMLVSRYGGVRNTMATCLCTSACEKVPFPSHESWKKRTSMSSEEDKSRQSTEHLDQTLSDLDQSSSEGRDRGLTFLDFVTQQEDLVLSCAAPRVAVDSADLQLGCVWSSCRDKRAQII